MACGICSLPPRGCRSIHTGLNVELDIFEAPFAPLMIAEVEFPNEAMANAFLPLDWFDQDVTQDPAYHNSNLSRFQV